MIPKCNDYFVSVIQKQMTLQLLGLKSVFYLLR